MSVLVTGGRTPSWGSLLAYQVSSTIALVYISMAYRFWSVLSHGMFCNRKILKMGFGECQCVFFNHWVRNLPDCPAYVAGQSWHPIWYTTPVFILTQTGYFLGVVMGQSWDLVLSGGQDSLDGHKTLVIYGGTTTAQESLCLCAVSIWDITPLPSLHLLGTCCSAWTGKHACFIPNLQLWEYVTSGPTPNNTTPWTAWRIGNKFPHVVAAKQQLHPRIWS